MLSRARKQGFSGPEAISYQEIAAWTSLTGEILLREEVSVLRRMDAAYLDAVAKADLPPVPGQQQKPSIQSQPINPALFDSMF